MRSKFAAVACAFGLALGLTGCPEGGEAAAADGPSAPIEGEWEVVNKDGKKTGQVVIIAPDAITMKNPMLKDNEGEATWSEQDGKPVAKWIGADFVFTVEEPGKKVVMEGGGQTYVLVRGDAGGAEGADAGGDAAPSDAGGEAPADDAGPAEGE